MYGELPFKMMNGKILGKGRRQSRQAGKLRTRPWMSSAQAAASRCSAAAPVAGMTGPNAPAGPTDSDKDHDRLRQGQVARTCP